MTAATSARERLLNAADELFYAEGIQSVGIDRIIEKAGVAKASLYNAYGSKDELVRAYLRSRHDLIATRIQKAVDAADGPRAKVLAVFDSQARTYRRPDYRGCAFYSASAEAPAGGTVEQESDSYRAWFRTLFTQLARDGGAADPEQLARQLHLIYDGTAQAVRMDRDPDDIAVAGRALVETLLDSALPA